MRKLGEGEAHDLRGNAASELHHSPDGSLAPHQRQRDRPEPRRQRDAPNPSDDAALERQLIAR